MATKKPIQPKKKKTRRMRLTLYSQNEILITNEITNNKWKRRFFLDSVFATYLEALNATTSYSKLSKNRVSLDELSNAREPFDLWPLMIDYVSTVAQQIEYTFSIDRISQINSFFCFAWNSLNYKFIRSVRFIVSVFFFWVASINYLPLEKCLCNQLAFYSAI